jgi:hypothetical protein
VKYRNDIQSTFLIDRAKGVVLQLLIVNLLEQACLRAPKNGCVSITLSGDKNGFCIAITDNGYNLHYNHGDNTSTFCVSALLLQKIATIIEADVTHTSQKMRGHKAEIKIQGNHQGKRQEVQSAPSSNVVYFPYRP